MYKVGLFFIGILFSNFVFAADASGENLWMQSTANSRAAAVTINNNIEAQEALQVKAAQQAQQNAQKASQPTQTLQPPAPTNSVTGGTINSNNPYLKPNPWQNTQNPYPGKQYPTVPIPTTTPTTTNSSTTIIVPTNNSPNSSSPVNTAPGTIYVNPTQPSQQKQNFNIYK